MEVKMDLDKPRQLCQNSQSNLERKVLRFCNPQSIAHKIENFLESEVTVVQKKGNDMFF